MSKSNYPDIDKVLLAAENAMLNARLVALKADEQNGDRLVAKGHRLFPCNQAVVHATEPGLDAIRAFRRSLVTKKGATK